MVILSLTTMMGSAKRTNLIPIYLCRVNMTSFRGTSIRIRVYETCFWDHIPVSSSECRGASVDRRLPGILVYTQS